MVERSGEERGGVVSLVYAFAEVEHLANPQDVCPSGRVVVESLLFNYIFAAGMLTLFSLG